MGQQQGLEDLLNDSKVLRNLMVKEIKADAKEFGDARRTLIQEEKKVVAEYTIRALEAGSVDGQAALRQGLLA